MAKRKKTGGARPPVPRAHTPLRQPLRATASAAPAARPWRLGTMSLVVIGTASLGAVLLTQCDSGPPPPEELPIDAQRTVYSSSEDCVADWGSDDRCEPDPNDPNFNPEGYGGTSGSGGGSHGAGGVYNSYAGNNRPRPRYLGPFYTSSGTVYEFDGRQSNLQARPSRMVATEYHRIAPAEIYSRVGRYGTTAAHAQASAGKAAGSRAISRGGFGGRAGSSGG